MCGLEIQVSVLKSDNQVHLKTQNFQIAEMDKKNQTKNNNQRMFPVSFAICF